LKTFEIGSSELSFITGYSDAIVWIFVGFKFVDTISDTDSVVLIDTEDDGFLIWFDLFEQVLANKISSFGNDDFGIKIMELI